MTAKPKPVTHRIYDAIFNILKKHPKGMRWTDLNKMVIASDKTFHPKTVNGCVWKLVEKYPDKVEKKDGLFVLL